MQRYEWDGPEVEEDPSEATMQSRNAFTEAGFDSTEYQKMFPRQKARIFEDH